MRRTAKLAARRHRITVIATFVATAVVIIGLAGWLASSRSVRPIAQTPAGTVDAAATDYGRAPSYALTDQHGQPFRSVQLHGKVQVVSYLFPYCTTQCPIIGHTLLKVQQALDRRGLGKQVEFVAFNVDPTGAGPVQLAAFLKQYGIDPANPHWHFLTGSDSDIRRVVQGGFHIFYERVSIADEHAEEARQKAAGTFIEQPEQPNALADKAHVGYDIVHNDAIEVVGPDGTIRDLFASGAQTSAGEVVAAVQKALDGG